MKLKLKIFKINFKNLIFDKVGMFRPLCSLTTKLKALCHFNSYTIKKETQQGYLFL